MPSDIEHGELLAQTGKSEYSVDLGGSAKQQQPPVLSVSILRCVADHVEAGGIDEAQLTQVQDGQPGVSQYLPQMPLQYWDGGEIQFTGKLDPCGARSALNGAVKQHRLKIRPY